MNEGVYDFLIDNSFNLLLMEPWSFIDKQYCIVKVTWLCNLKHDSHMAYGTADKVFLVSVVIFE